MRPSPRGGAGCDPPALARIVVDGSTWPMTDRPAALFEPDGAALVPTDLARGPWDRDALHGGPTAAVVARAVEHHLAASADQGSMFAIARLTLELLRPVPTAPLEVQTRTSRPGRKVTLVEASVTAGPSREVARAVVLGVRHRDVALPTRVTPPPPPARPDGAEPSPQEGDWVAFHNDGVEMRFVSGGFRQPGPAVVWMRLRVPVVEGEVTSPVMRAVAVADFGNGISSELEMGPWRFLNPELTVHLARPPVGEWVGVDARTVLGTGGSGLAESVLFDVDGACGRAVQALLVERA